MRVFTILGPSQSGKTTLARALAGLDGAMGKRRETATVAAMQPFSFMGEDWAAIEISGGAENRAQVGPALTASDAAVLCVPADPEAAVLAAPYLRQLEEAGIPVFLFVNRMDQATGRIADIIAALQTYSQHSIVLRQVPIRQDGQVVGAVDLISERAWKYIEDQPSALIELPEEMQLREKQARSEMLEALADFDDHLLEELIEDREVLAAEAYDVATQVLQHGEVFPAFLGAAEHRNGVLRLMKSLRHEVPQVAATRARLAGAHEGLGDVVAVGCMADQVKHLGKTVLLRALDSGLEPGLPVGGSTLGGLTGLSAASPGPGGENGNGESSVAAQRGGLLAGDIGQAVKSDHLNLGYCYSADSSAGLPSWAQPRPSTYRRLVVPVHDRDEARLATALDRLLGLDPAVGLEQDAISGRALLHLQGPLHLRRVLATLEKEFGVEAHSERVPPTFCETLRKPVEQQYRHRKQSGGAGQFADVWIEIQPLPRGAGFKFQEQVKGGAVPKAYITSVEAGVREALDLGQNGHPVVDVEVTLKDGKHHAVDSSDFAFRIAGRNAVRNALDQAEVVLLQPIMRLNIHAPSVFSGGLIPLVSSLKGQVLGLAAEEQAAGWDVLEVLLPLSAQDTLCHSLASATRGTGWFETTFDHYEEARHEDPAPA